MLVPHFQPTHLPWCLLGPISSAHFWSKVPTWFIPTKRIDPTNLVPDGIPFPQHVRICCLLVKAQMLSVNIPEDLATAHGQQGVVVPVAANGPLPHPWAEVWATIWVSITVTISPTPHTARTADGMHWVEAARAGLQEKITLYFRFIQLRKWLCHSVEAVNQAILIEIDFQLTVIVPINSLT